MMAELLSWAKQRSCFHFLLLFMGPLPLGFCFFWVCLQKLSWEFTSFLTSLKMINCQRPISRPFSCFISSLVFLFSVFTEPRDKSINISRQINFELCNALWSLLWFLLGPTDILSHWFLSSWSLGLYDQTIWMTQSNDMDDTISVVLFEWHIIRMCLCPQIFRQHPQKMGNSAIANGE